MIEVLQNYHEGVITSAEACKRLGIHRTTLWRLCRRLEKEGPAGLAHKLRGRRSNSAKPEAFRRQVCDLYAREYRPHGHSIHFFYRKAAPSLPDYVSYKTILSWLRAAGLS